MSERLYYLDSFLKTFTGTVTGVRETTDGRGDSLWQMSLNRTAFYPTSGGQPFDKGKLRAISLDGGDLEVPVEQVEEDDHGEVWHFVRRPLAAGTQVEGQIDWERRFDHMQQHSGQHLLSALFMREYRMPTVSFHLGEKTSTIDLARGQLALQDLEKMERFANVIISEDRAVTTRSVTRVEAEAMLAVGELRKLPDLQGLIRLIDIAECDCNACGGTHVCSTGQIGGLLVRGLEKVNRGVRVEFACGLRAVRIARADAAILSEITRLLSTGGAELPAAVGLLLAESKAGARERKKLREDLATFQASELAEEAPVENGLRLVVREWNDGDREYVKLLASRTTAAALATAVIFCAKDFDPVRVYVARSADLEFDCGQLLREALASLGLRGGGSATMAQGDVPTERAAELCASVADAIRRAVEETHKTEMLHPE